jgi:hypothetical protein
VAAIAISGDRDGSREMSLRLEKDVCRIGEAGEVGASEGAHASLGGHRSCEKPKEKSFWNPFDR